MLEQRTEEQKKGGAMNSGLDADVNGNRVYVIANPVAGGGRTGRILGLLTNLLRSSFGDATTVYCTGKTGDATASARQAVLNGSRHLVIVGGDGTIHECVNGVYSLPSLYTANITLSIISTGTGCGLARSLGIPCALEQQIAVARGSHTRAIDIGQIQLEGQTQPRFFVNECQIGIGAEVVRRTSKARKAVGGSLAYALATVPLLFSYPNPVVELGLDMFPPILLPITGISIGNGDITGGGMHLTPRAVLDDGLIDVLVMNGQSPFHRATGFLRVRSGGHIHSPHFSYHQARVIRISSCSDLLLAADGEMIGKLPARLESLPGAIRIHCPLEHRMENGHEHLPSKAETIGV
jgi:YegS/Rv2252/BmrU family lipid kinase